MLRDNLNDVLAFLTVARERSFTRAAAQLGVSQSALSHAMRGLEARLGLRLLARTTRSVAPTEAGERLLRALGTALRGDRDRACGLERTPGQAGRHGAHQRPASTRPKRSCGLRFQSSCRAIRTSKVELIIDYGLTDIVAERYDAGVRLGEQVGKGHDRGARRPRLSHGGRGARRPTSPAGRNRRCRRI